ncbi:hypothetical protein GCM10009544_55730 [Streptomyces stramineus]|uniref:Uncharacterized protein n=1 Tax=Streptomyces stramineus TaxID=173861 RepID=A0ABN1AZL7_9ACTN
METSVPAAAGAAATSSAAARVASAMACARLEALSARAWCTLSGADPSGAPASVDREAAGACCPTVSRLLRAIELSLSRDEAAAFRR